MSSTPSILQAGPIQARYENGFLRYLTHHDAEIVRLIYFAVRDRNWRTAAFTITDERIDQTANSFRVTYDWHVNDLAIQMTGQVTLEGDEKGRISVDFYGQAVNSFQKNRIGLCALHPITDVLGQPAQVIAPDGSVQTSHFPVSINPNQPFLNIQSLRWRPASGVTWQLDFSGDVFETEDQRNWTDASFKTYSTPSFLPFPVAVSAGDVFRQQVIFSAAETPLSAPAATHELAERSQLMASLKPTSPSIGVSQWAGGPPLTDREATLLRQLNLSHLRADVFFSLPEWQTLLANAIADAQKLSIPLELAVFFGNDAMAELQALRQLLRFQSIPIRSLSLFDGATLRTSTELLQALTPTLRAEWPDLLIGGGTDDNFVEWNRHRFDTNLVDFVTYSINPQVHAFDDLTLQENIAGQTETALSAHVLGNGKPIHISPVTLLPRFTTLSETASERLNAPADHRQTTAFGADWTRQSLTALANAGVAAITYYQTHGPNGVANDGTVYPLFNTLKNRR